MAEEKGSAASVYKHGQESVQRPDAGVEAQFSNKKAPKTYRYDSSLAPELSWDESADRAFAEWLLALVTNAAEKGESEVFASPQVWQGNGENFSTLSQCAARLRSLTKPFLNWAGKAERQQITVPTLPLFVHERHSTQAILETLKSHKALGTNLDLFGDTNLDVADKLDAYEHKGPWTNRLILGDSLHVMNSLTEYEGMGGQVQMIYFDPPYGVKFGSNFQPFVRKRDVKHGPDDHMSREPEMVKAYRDTWELGLHSYLTYLRDRLTLARELLTDSGSLFVQISDENLHHTRELLDEIFGGKNFVSQITFQTKIPLRNSYLPGVCDYILWYGKNFESGSMKFNRLFVEQTLEDSQQFSLVELNDGAIRTLEESERKGADLPDGARVFTSLDLASSGRTESCVFDFEWKGKSYSPTAGKSWKTNRQGMRKLAQENRLYATKNALRYKLYFDDYPVQSLTNIWTDSVGVSGKVYVVQTDSKVVARCMLMSSDPGDLVLDITCGSGTTAYVAEQWGRRWITVDTSRVPISLARQRLLTSTFPWYKLKTPAQGPAAGFVYERKKNRKGEDVGGLVPHVTLGSITNNEEPELVTVVDRPEIASGVTRVTGPFTVEATINAAMSFDEDTPTSSPPPAFSSPRAYLDRMIEVLRQSKTLRLPGNVTLELERISPLVDREYLHAEGVTSNGTANRIAFVFGPEDGAIGSEYVFSAHTEALQRGYQQLFLFGFAIQAKAREMLDKLKIPTTYVSVTPDVVMSDLLKTTKSSQIFSITGLPDVSVEQAGKEKDGTPLYRVVIKGLDIFRPDTMETDEIKAENLPCWMLDSNYNGMVFMATQVFFPKTGAWENLQKSLKSQFNDAVWEHLAGTVSEPFVMGDKKRIAVKAIDERGNELMVVKLADGGL
ncbi:site-specific DNA-methyltransferase [Mesorhizobium sp. B2-5-13]|uniref:site-specific DNA-methyltransferase n=1 Tax=unclassified Mesorhizobium TaxID=325217 RepID=UPI001128898B|nr:MULTISPECIES: site-specific DNA-methyltransferase [unclassified Mesorhizobium]TPJ90599.1 site-specific DNA-methyltransferase [Mesorhizobium sp. B2-5-13]TPK39129.1 site-specific DNA-methyltransferase [Mesorhizobium sp. B2-5-5]